MTVKIRTTRYVNKFNDILVYEQKVRIMKCIKLRNITKLAKKKNKKKKKQVLKQTQKAWIKDK